MRAASMMYLHVIVIFAWLAGVPISFRAALCKGKMTVRAMVTANERFEVTGTCYDSEGSFTKDNADIRVEDEAV